MITKGYCPTTIGEVVEDRVSQAGPTRSFIYLDIGGVDRETKAFVELKTVPLSDAPSRARQVVQPADVLVSMTRPNLNAVAMVAQVPGEVIASTGFHVLRSTWIEPKFLFYLVQTEEFIQKMSALVQGALYPAVRPKDILSYRFNLPPLAEQARIVEKLEEMLSELYAGVAELKAAQQKVARYRQSLLKTAVDGTLTADWRGSHEAREVETLPRVLSDRRSRWEETQIAKFTEQGKSPPKGWQAKYPNPVAPAGRLSPLPAGWTWATLSQIGFLDRGRSKHRPRNAPHLYGGAYPFVQTGDIRHADTFLDRAESTYSEAGLAQSRLWPAGTMCITIAANIGKTAILGMDACFPDSVVGFLPASTCVSVRYVEYFMRTAQQSLEDDAPATAQKNINLEILEKLRVPLPSYEEQLRIVELLDELLRVAKDQEHAIAISISKAAAQRKSTLSAAFSGQLVPQDPNDEPATRLLMRIAQSRMAVPTEAKSRKKKNMRRSSSVEDVRLMVRKMPSDRFSSEDLFASTGGDYDAFKDSLFELLTEKDTILRQEFDEESRRMMLVREQA